MRSFAPRGARLVAALAVALVATVFFGGSAWAQDLVVSKLTPSTTTPKQGQEITVTVAIKNDGNVAVPATSTAIYLSRDATINTYDTRLALVNTTALDPGKEWTDSVKVTIRGDLGSGTRYLGAIADVANAAAEVDEGNNTRAVAINIQATALPDLRAVSLRGTPPTLAVGGEITLTRG